MELDCIIFTFQYWNPLWMSRENCKLRLETSKRTEGEDITDKESENSQRMFAIINATCAGHNDGLLHKLRQSLLLPKVKMVDRLLVIEFNNPHYESIPFLESLYRPSIPNILCCTLTPIVNSTAEFSLFTLNLRVDEVGYLEDWKIRKLHVEVIFKQYPKQSVNYTLNYIIHDQGKANGFRSETPNYCIEAAIHKLPGFKGYIYIADDTVFHFWKSTKLDPNRFWWYDTHPTMLKDLDTEEAIRCSNTNGTLSACTKAGWIWFDIYKEEIAQTYRTMQRYSLLSQSCLEEISKKCEGRSAVVGGASDFYYVPGERMADFVHMSGLFRVMRLWHEISVPMMMYGLNTPEELQLADIYHNWNYYTDRQKPWKWYHQKLDTISVHPLKLGPVAHEKINDTLLFCNLIFPNAFNHIYTDTIDA